MACPPSVGDPESLRNVRGITMKLGAFRNGAVPASGVSANLVSFFVRGVLLGALPAVAVAQGTAASTRPNPSSTSNTTTINQTQRGQQRLKQVLVRANRLSLGGG